MRRIAQHPYLFSQFFQKRIAYFDEMIRLCEASPEINKSTALEWVLQRNLVLELYTEMQKELNLPNLVAKEFVWEEYYQHNW